MINISQFNYEFGAFVRHGNNGYAQVAKNNPHLHLSLKIQPLSPQEIILQISIENRGDDQVLNSLFVDFELPDFIPEEVLENAWTQSGFSGYKPGIHPSRKRKLFLLRDQNPCSFLPEYGYIKNAQISEWYTQLLGTHQALLIGAVTTGKQFTSIYILKQGKGTFVRVACQLDGIILNSGEICQSETRVPGGGRPRSIIGKICSLAEELCNDRNAP